MHDYYLELTKPHRIYLRNTDPAFRTVFFRSVSISQVSLGCKAVIVSDRVAFLRERLKQAVIVTVYRERKKISE